MARMCSLPEFSCISPRCAELLRRSAVPTSGVVAISGEVKLTISEEILIINNVMSHLLKHQNFLRRHFQRHPYFFFHFRQLFPAVQGITDVSHVYVFSGGCGDTTPGRWVQIPSPAPFLWSRGSTYLVYCGRNF